MTDAPPDAPEMTEAERLAAEWAAALAEAEREVAELEAAERAAGIDPANSTSRPTSPAPQPQSPRRRIPRRLLLPCLIGGALIGTVTQVVRAVVQNNTTTEDSSERTHDRPIVNLAQVDILMQAGATEEALELLATQPLGNTDIREVAYRQALGLELLGQLAAADEAYQRAAADPTAAGWARAILGRARCAAAGGDVELAWNLLNQIGCRADRWIFAECLHLRARLHTLGSHTPQPPDLLAPDAPAWPPFATAAVDHLGPVGVQARSAAVIAVAAGLLSEPGSAEAFRLALALAPNHPAAAGTRIALGNLELRAGRWREAGQEYARVLAEHSRDAEAIYAAYNHALVQLNAGHQAESRRLFLEVIDRDPRGKWGDLGRCWIGRTHLDERRTKMARRAFRTIRPVSTGLVQSAARIGICVSYLIDGNDEAAGKALGHVCDYPAGYHSAWANLLEHWLRHRSDPTAKSRDVLRIALLGVGDGRTLGRTGMCLVARCVSELGVSESQPR